VCEYRIGVRVAATRVVKVTPFDSKCLLSIDRFTVAIRTQQKSLSDKPVGGQCCSPTRQWQRKHKLAHPDTVGQQDGKSAEFGQGAQRTYTT